MNAKTLHNPAELRKLGLKALTDALGPVGMARFLAQYETGAGDYTLDRAAWAKGKDVATLVRAIKRK